MAVVKITMWDGIRHRCSRCGEYGYPRVCRCGVAHGAFVMDVHDWLIRLECTGRRRLEMVVDSQRQFSTKERM